MRKTQTQPVINITNIAHKSQKTMCGSVCAHLCRGATFQLFNYYHDSHLENAILHGGPSCYLEC